MKLDFNPAKEVFVLYVLRDEADPEILKQEFGMTFSLPASTPETAVLFTYEPYRAASFAHVATERARDALLNITTAIEASWAADVARHVSVPAHKELWPFQRASASYCLDRTHALDADQPGLGKTPTAIAINNEIQAGHALVVCPASIRHQWRERIIEWDIDALDNRDIAVIVSSRRGIPWPLPKWTIISWELVHSPGLWRALAKSHFDHLILDEAHYAKNPLAKRTRAIFAKGGAAWHARRIWAATGTPAPNNPAELWPLMRAFGVTPYDYEDFVSRYCRVDRNGFIRGGKRAMIPELHRALVPVALRRMKSEVMPELGRIDVQELAVEPRMDWVPKDIYPVIEDFSTDAAITVEWLLQHRTKLATWRRYTALTKAPAVYDTIKFELARGLLDKVVVYGYHREALFRLYRHSIDDGIEAELITGDTPERERHEAIARFNVRSKVMYANILAAGTAINLAASHQGIMLELDWVPGNNVQAMQRMHRSPQTKPVTIRVAVAANTVDEVVTRVLESKTADLLKLWEKE